MNYLFLHALELKSTKGRNYRIYNTPVGQSFNSFLQCACYVLVNSCLHRALFRFGADPDVEGVHHYPRPKGVRQVGARGQGLSEGYLMTQ